MKLRNSSLDEILDEVHLVLSPQRGWRARVSLAIAGGVYRLARHVALYALRAENRRKL